MYPTYLSIPVRDTEGRLLFYKHRRNFKDNEGIKYRYDKGATAALFGAETLRDLPLGARVIITESELDALAMRSLGYDAVSGTGGAGTWKEEWITLLYTFNIIILYDADKAGIEGALKVASMIPTATIAWVPVQYGKDPTEVIHKGQTKALEQALSNAHRYEVPTKDAPKRLEALKSLQKTLLAEKQECLKDSTRTPFHVDIALDWVKKELSLEYEWSDRQSSREKYKGDRTDVEKARTYPIRDLIKVNRQHKAVCLFHTDKDPSMHVYKDNHAYCFVCNKRADAINIYMALNNCSFKEALKALI